MEDVFGIIRDLQTKCHVGSQRRETFLLIEGMEKPWEPKTWHFKQTLKGSVGMAAQQKEQFVQRCGDRSGEVSADLVRLQRVGWG